MAAAIKTVRLHFFPPKFNRHADNRLVARYIHEAMRVHITPHGITFGQDPDGSRWADVDFLSVPEFQTARD